MSTAARKVEETFDSTVTAALVTMKGRGGVTACALPVRYNEMGVLQPYKGSNVILLALAGEHRKSSVWGSVNALKQASGLLMREGETAAARVVFAGYDRPVQAARVNGFLEPLTGSESDAHTSGEAAPRVRIYKSLPTFNADQLAGIEGRMTTLGADCVMPDVQSIRRDLQAALHARTRRASLDEHELPEHLASAVLALGEAMVKWRYGIKAHVVSQWFDDTPDLLAVCGVAQRCVDTLTLPEGFFAFGVPLPRQGVRKSRDQAPATPRAPATVSGKASVTAKPRKANVPKDQAAALRAFLA